MRLCTNGSLAELAERQFVEALGQVTAGDGDAKSLITGRDDPAKHPEHAERTGEPDRQHSLLQPAGGHTACQPTKDADRDPDRNGDHERLRNEIEQQFRAITVAQVRHF